MSHHYQLRTLIAELNESAGSYLQNGGSTEGTSLAKRGELVGLAISTIVGFRAIDPLMTACHNGNEAVNNDNRKAVLKLISEAGEAMYLPSQKVLSTADKIYTARWEVFAAPIVAFEQPSFKDFLEKECSGSSDFIYGWLERGVQVVNTYIGEFNEVA